MATSGNLRTLLPLCMLIIIVFAQLILLTEGKSLESKLSSESSSSESSESKSASDSQEIKPAKVGEDFDDTGTGKGASSSPSTTSGEIIDTASFEQKLVAGKEKNFRSAALTAVNYYRGLHGVPPLALDPSLNSKAQAWADYLASSGSLEPSCKSTDAKCKYTESIASLEPNENLSAAATSAIQQWYGEGLKNSYKYGSLSPIPPDAKNVADFTAMLWKTSKQVGFGLAIDKNSGITFVANYIPGGNIAGMYAKNVLP